MCGRIGPAMHMWPTGDSSGWGDCGVPALPPTIPLGLACCGCCDWPCWNCNCCFSWSNPPKLPDPSKMEGNKWFFCSKFGWWANHLPAMGDGEDGVWPEAHPPCRFCVAFCDNPGRACVASPVVGLGSTTFAALVARLWLTRSTSYSSWCFCAVVFSGCWATCAASAICSLPSRSRLDNAGSGDAAGPATARKPLVDEFQTRWWPSLVVRLWRLLLDWAALMEMQMLLCLRLVADCDDVEASSTAKKFLNLLQLGPQTLMSHHLLAVLIWYCFFSLGQHSPCCCSSTHTITEISLHRSAYNIPLQVEGTTS